MWDRNQTDVLPRNHFKYCLTYRENRPNGRPENGELHLWISKIRMYQNEAKIQAALAEQLPKAVPDGFCDESADRGFSISHRFFYPDDLDELPGMIIPLLKDLVLAVHPILMQVIDTYTGPVDKQTLRQIIAQRDKIHAAIPKRPNAESYRAYNRYITPAMRKAILKRDKHHCAHCGADLRITGHHIDHIKPFSKGGLTVEDNLQALCPECNLRKGNR
jgi:hypothetical protein